MKRFSQHILLVFISLFLATGDVSGEPYCGNSPVRILETMAYYPDIQAGYNAAVNGQTIQVQIGVFLNDLTFANSSAVKISGGYSCDYSTNTDFTKMYGTVIITGGAVTTKNIIIGADSSQTSAPPKPWIVIPAGDISYMPGTSCPVDSNLQCSQKISNGPSCLYQSCTCFFSQAGVGDTASGFWKTFDMSGNRTGTFDCKSDGGLTGYQIEIGSCSMLYSAQATAFVNGCATCTYVYSDWSECQSDNTQSRTVISSPEGCTGTPELTQSCTYVPSAVCGNGICESGENSNDCPSDCADTGCPNRDNSCCTMSGGNLIQIIKVPTSCGHCPNENTTYAGYIENGYYACDCDDCPWWE